jgi:copper chaperone CopZ
MAHLKLHVSNMSCGHCVGRVRKALDALEGVQVKHVSVGEAELELDAARQTPAAVLSALDAAGYPATLG